MTFLRPVVVHVAPHLCEAGMHPQLAAFVPPFKAADLRALRLSDLTGHSSVLLTPAGRHFQAASAYMGPTGTFILFAGFYY